MIFRTIKPLTHTDTLFVEELQRQGGPAAALSADKKGLLCALLGLLRGDGIVTTLALGEEDCGIDLS